MTETRIAADLAALDAVARLLAAGLRPGDVVALSGPLGAGKTAFVAALVRALHGDDATVSSPTFVLRQRYDGTPPVEHLDLYRLDDPADAIEAGLADAFDGDAIAVVEWPERAPGLLPPATIRIAIAGHGDGARILDIVRP